MIRRISPDFAYYLKKRGAYGNFIFYAKRTTGPTEMPTWFNWKKTKQGYLYWNSILSGFGKYLFEKYRTNGIIHTN